MLSLHRKKVCEERKAQVAFNEELKRQKLVAEQMFSKLWKEDQLAKEKREAQEARRQKELVENTRLGLNAQITTIQVQRQAAQRLKEEEARLVVGFLKCLLGDDQLDGYCAQFAGLLLCNLSNGMCWQQTMDINVQLIEPSHWMGLWASDVTTVTRFFPLKNEAKGTCLCYENERR